MSEAEKKAVSEEIKEEKAAGQETAAPAEAGKPAGRKKPPRWFRITLIILLVIVVVLLILAVSIGKIVETAVRTVGPKVTGTRVELASVHTALLRGYVNLNGFKVGNPEGFKEPDIFVLEKFVCTVPPASIFSDKIIIEEVVIDGMKFNYEPNLSGGSNLAVLQKHIESFTGADQPAKKKPEAEEKKPKEEKPAKQILIKKIVVKNVEMSFSNQMLNTTMTLPLPDITITNVGDGKTIVESMQSFFVELAKSAGRALASSGKAVGDAALKSLDAIGAEGQKAIESLGEQGKQALEGLKGLFKSEEKK